MKKKTGNIGVSKQIQKRELRAGIAFISPWIVGFLLFMAYPILSSLYYSLHEYNIISKPEFIGFENYIELFRDELFLKSLWNTLYMVVFGILAVTVVSLIISVMLDDKRIKGLSFFRVVFFMPTLVPLVILSILWIWILQPDYGVINTALKAVGIRGPGWFADPAWSKPAFILMMVWGSGNVIIIYLAGLKDIPVSLYEAAAIDGAGWFPKFFRITLPMLKPIITFNVITGIIKVLQSFAEAFIITSGGPNGSTHFFSLHIYYNAFQWLKMGYASAMAWILLIIALGVVLLLFKLSGFEGVESK